MSTNYGHKNYHTCAVVSTELAGLLLTTLPKIGKLRLLLLTLNRGAPLVINAIMFIVTTACYLLLIDFRILFQRIFWSPSVEPLANSIGPQAAHWILANARLFMGIQLKNETAKNLINSLPPRFIALTNHQSLFDILIVFDLFYKFDIRFVAKSTLKNGFPGVSQVLRFGRHALIDRKGSARKTFEHMSSFARRCVSKGYCPAIFPEGTRSRTGDLGTFHPAGLRMILDQGTVPVVVAALDGGYRIATVRDFFGPGSKKLKMKILQVFPPPQGKEDTKQLLEKAKGLIDQQLIAWRQSGP